MVDTGTRSSGRRVLNMDMLICGVDEAGRGPVLGPLVVAAVSCRDQESLRELGVKDSKLLSRAKRESLYEDIDSSYPYQVIIREAAEIDRPRESISLNDLELEMFAAAVTALSPRKVYADCAERSEDAFGRRLGALLPSGTEVLSKHHADRDFPAVSAASIVAKVLRDRAMDVLSEQAGEELGSGYPSDPRSIGFLERWINDKGYPPPCARASWETTRRIMRLGRLSKITDW